MIVARFVFPSTGTLMWKLLVVVGGVGVTVGVISLCLALLCAKRDSGNNCFDL